MPKPPKPKLHRKPGSGDGNKSSLSAAASSDPGLDPFENFEIELLWCIQQLESSFSSKKINPRTAEDNMKALNTLKSNKAPLIRKRQVMRSLFGDYRAKMAEEEKKLYKANSNLKFASSSTVIKSKFLKKSSSLKPKSNEASTSCASPISTEPSSKEMQCDEAFNDGGSMEEVALQTEKKSFSFKPSDNQFRFNFSSSGEDIKSCETK
ncbi:UPF0488 protein CG14286 [Hetaerina americana]|uniref:UPF0488 protein CG14286 n=1 Tax=Hetaerina americana TaxID=62018 RepID=UPI003A7F2AA6